MGLSGCPVADPGMPPAPIVEDFDVFEQCRFGLPPGAELCPMNQLGLERAEERLHRRIVKAVALTAHGRLDAIAVEDLAVWSAGVLGGFKWSSQHPDEGGCDEEAKAAFGSVRAGCSSIARPAPRGAA